MALKFLIVLTVALGVAPLCALSDSKNYTESNFKIRSTWKPFLLDQTHRILISKSCLKPNQLLDCDAYRSLQMIDSSESNESSDSEPGVAICSMQLKMTVVTGFDPQGNQNSFCEFDDGSLLDLGTLTYYAFHLDRRPARVQSLVRPRIKKK